MLDRRMTFPVHFCFTLEFLLSTKYPRESATSFCSPHLPTWVGSTHGLWVCGFKKDTSNRYYITDAHETEPNQTEQSLRIAN